MKVVSLLSVARMNREPGPFWPHGIKRLVVVVWQPASGDLFVALGIDPDHGHGHGQVVVETEVPHDRLSSFIKAVIDGNRSELEHHCHQIATVTADHLAVSDPMQLRRKASLALATAIGSEERLAEDVVSPPSRRHPRQPAKDHDC